MKISLIDMKTAEYQEEREAKLTKNRKRRDAKKMFCASVNITRTDTQNLKAKLLLYQEFYKKCLWIYLRKQLLAIHYHQIDAVPLQRHLSVYRI